MDTKTSHYQITTHFAKKHNKEFTLGLQVCQILECEDEVLGTKTHLLLTLGFNQEDKGNTYNFFLA